MKCIKMIDGDAVITQGSFSFIEDKETSYQNIKNRLYVNQGEWFLDLEQGLLYNNIRGKGVTVESVKLSIAQCLAQEKEVDYVEFINISINNSSRYIEVEFIVHMLDETKIYMKEVLDESI